MPKFNIKVDDKGNFYTKAAFKLVELDLGGPGPEPKKVSLKLLKPTDARIKVLTLTLNKKTFNVTVATGKLVFAGPYPLVAGDNQISFEGTSDQPDEPHEIQVTPQLLN